MPGSSRKYERVNFRFKWASGTGRELVPEAYIFLTRKCPKFNRRVAGKDGTAKGVKMQFNTCNLVGLK